VRSHQTLQMKAGQGQWTPRRSRLQTRAGASAVKLNATALDDQQKQPVTVLLLDECECEAEPLAGRADASVSSVARANGVA
jgi:hypothetical protein